MIHRATAYFAIVVVAIACTNLWPVSASGPQLVKLSVENRGVEQCLQPLDDNKQEERSKLRLRFTITNVSGQPLIIYHHAPSSFDARLSRRVVDFPKIEFNYEYQPKFNCAPPLNFDATAPGNDFRILPPNESLTHEPEPLEFADTTSIELPKRRLEGDYFIKLRVATWYWDVSKAETLGQRWASYGRLFYDHLTTEPIAITIPKPGSNTPRCDTVSLK